MFDTSEYVVWYYRDFIFVEPEMSITVIPYISVHLLLDSGAFSTEELW